MQALSNTSIHLGDCTRLLSAPPTDWSSFDLTFLDPPFNQGKDYRQHDDSMTDSDYWGWMSEVCKLTLHQSSLGAAMYFMQREKNTEQVLTVLRESGWHFQNLIIWKKKTSAVPSTVRFGKAYQIIAYATKGPRARVFNRLRVNPPLPNGYSPRENGMFVTDIWDDIRELTSGYFAGDEALRTPDGERVHKQQSPIALLLRIVLSSTKLGDCVFDPFAGTGTTLSVASPLGREAIGVEKDPKNFEEIEKRLSHIRDADSVERYRKHYVHTSELDEIWPIDTANSAVNRVSERLPQMTLVG